MRATYRLQLGPDLDFAGAAAQVGYLAALGVSHLYLSPVLQARPGSTHGYDVADHGRISAELGGEEGLRGLASAAHTAGLGLVADLVPNHVGTSPDTPLWWALLRDGQSGEGGRWFDVDWEPPLPGAAGKVILPVLDRPYGDALIAGEIVLGEHAGLPCVAVGEQRFPLSAAAVQALERAGGPSAMDGSPGERGTWGRMHSLLEMQHYRLVDWRAGGRLVNYRRFFAINDLAAIRVEDQAVFEGSHALVLRLVREGVLDGLRIDHVDGLADPLGYLVRLREAAGPEAWIVVEKILAADEDLPAGWPVAGTTGYEAGGALTGLAIDPQGLLILGQVARRYDAVPVDFDTAAMDCKAEAAEEELGPDVRRLANVLWDACQDEVGVRDVDFRACLAAVGRTLVALDVYRTYSDPGGGGAPDGSADLARVQGAIERARTVRSVGSRAVPERLWDFLEDALAGRPSRHAATVHSGPGAVARRILARRFPQVSSAVTAKGVEDTFLYRHARLLAACDVGVDPLDPVVDVAGWHDRVRRLVATQPGGMRGTSTHDTKRGEDVRLRIAALSELSHRWREATRRWRRAHADLDLDTHLRLVACQLLVGVWPVGDDGRGPAVDVVDDTWRDRVLAALVKSAREDGRRTTWADPDAAYERSIGAFLEAVTGGPLAEAFLGELRALARDAAEIAMVSGLAGALLKATMPGVPDVYQGTERWEDSLVDPDNRRPVDFGALAEGLDLGADPAALWAARRDGRVKQWVLARTLATLRDHPSAFAPGAAYTPLAVSGRWADHVVAFARGEGEAVVVAPSLPGRVTDAGAFAPLGRIWADTTVALPPGGPWHCALNAADHPGPDLALAEAFAHLPVALLIRELSCPAGDAGAGSEPVEGIPGDGGAAVLQRDDVAIDPPAGGAAARPRVHTDPSALQAWVTPEPLGP